MGMFSTMGRLLAEALDTEIIGNMTTDWFKELKANIGTGDFATHNATLFHPSSWPKKELKGIGITEAPRGALGHWVTINNDKISNYQCVVPTTWNAAPAVPTIALAPTKRRFRTASTSWLSTTSR